MTTAPLPLPLPLPHVVICLPYASDLADEPAAPRGRKIGAGKGGKNGSSKNNGASKRGLGKKGKTVDSIPEFPMAGGGCS